MLSTSLIMSFISDYHNKRMHCYRVLVLFCIHFLSADKENKSLSLTLIHLHVFNLNLICYSCLTSVFVGVLSNNSFYYNKLTDMLNKKERSQPALLL